MFVLLAALNIIMLITASGFMGYYIGKGKIEVVRPVEMTDDIKAQIEKQIKEQQEAIDRYNEMCRSLENYGG